MPSTISTIAAPFFLRGHLPMTELGKQMLIVQHSNSSWLSAPVVCIPDMSTRDAVRADARRAHEVTLLWRVHKRPPACHQVKAVQDHRNLFFRGRMSMKEVGKHMLNV